MPEPPPTAEDHEQNFLDDVHEARKTLSDAGAAIDAEMVERLRADRGEPTTDHDRYRQALLAIADVAARALGTDKGEDHGS